MKYIIILLVALTSCSSYTSLQRKQIKDAKFEARLKQAKADTLSIYRSSIQHFNDPYLFNRFNYGSYYNPGLRIIINRNNRKYGNNNYFNRRSSSTRNRIIKTKPKVQPRSLPMRPKGRQITKQ